MKLEQLEQLIEIEKQQSISKAAKALYMGQSTLSGALSSLEEELGVRLFERTAGGVKPTPEGKEAVQLARQMLELAEQMLRLGEAQRQLHGKVTVSVGQAYSFLYKNLLLKFRQRHPKAELDLQIGTTEQLITSLLAGDTNLVLALLYTPELEKLKEAEFCHETFGQCHFQVYAGQHNRFAERTTLVLEELQEEQFVINAMSYWELVRQQIPFTKECFVVTDRDTLRQMVSGENMLAILPDIFMKQDVYYEQGKTKILPVSLDVVLPPVTITLLYPKKRTLTLLEQSTLQLLQELLMDIQQS